MLLKLISQEAANSRTKILVMAGLSGVGNAAMLTIVNDAAATAASPSVRLLIMYLLACALYALCLHGCVSMVSGLFETALYNVRLRVADKIRKADLLGLEQIGTSVIYERLTQETSAISQAAWPIALAIQSVVMGAVMALYLLYLSPLSFLIAAGLFGVGAVIYHFRNLRAQEFLNQTSVSQVGLFDRLSDLLGGFKETRFRVQRGEALFEDYQNLASELRNSTVQANLLQEGNYLFGNLNLFALLGAIVFIMPSFVSQQTEVLNNITSAVLFLFNAIGGVLWALPPYGRAQMAAENIYSLEQRLDQAARGPLIASRDPWQGQFKDLQLQDVQFHYSAADKQEPFAIGPLSLTVRAGEILFIVGGNGSGKSTLVKVLSALYAPTAGTISVNGALMNADNVQAYREMIAAIFGDFHLFKKLYGLPEIQDPEVEQLLTKMQIAHKTRFSDGSFSALELSTGQRKRVAMAVALLEDRPIYVFDEWAADQDPEFRRYYYEELLQELKQRGKAVIAISHDDRYFHCADQVVTMEYGQIRSVETYQDGRNLSVSQRSDPSKAN